MPAYEEILRKAGVTHPSVSYVGDDLPGLPVMHRVGLAVAVGNAFPEVKETAHYVTKARAEKQPSLRGLFSPRAELDQFSLLRLRDGSRFPLKVCRYVKLNYAGHHSILRSWRSFWSGLAVGCCRRVTHHPKPPPCVNQDHPEKRSHTCLACRAFARFVWRLPNRQNAFRQ